MTSAENNLLLLSEDDIRFLSGLYQNYERAPYVYSFLNTAIKWKQSHSDYMTLYAPHDWKKDGTFLAVFEFSCYQYFLFTQSEDNQRLYNIILAKLSTLAKPAVTFFSIHSDYYQMILKIAEELNLNVNCFGDFDVWAISKEEAQHFDASIPDDVYVAKLTPLHIPLVNSLWPHRFPGSEKYLSSNADLNSAYGIFSKSDNQLLSWIFKNQLGQLGILQTITEQKGKGYGAILTKIMSIEIANDGHQPIAHILDTNFPCKKLFSKLGFKIIGTVQYFSVLKKE